MDLRCDSKADCDDFSDERACTIIQINSNYMKEKIPPKLEDESAVKVIIGVDLISLLNIDVVQGKLHTQIQLSMAWKDPRITFQNLKKDRNLNLFSPKERKMLWIPNIIFKNTKNRLVSINDAKTFIAIDREGSFRWVDEHILHNVFLFEGSDNTIIMSRNYAEEFICDFNIAMYPFDIQTCSMDFITTPDIGNLIELNNGILQYLGNTLISQISYLRLTRVSCVFGIGVYLLSHK